MEVGRAVRPGAAATASRRTGIGSRPFRSLVVASVVALAACTTDRPETAPTRAPSADPRIDGTLLVFTDFRGGLATIELPDGDPEPLELPVAFVRAAFFLEDGSVLAVMDQAFDTPAPYIVSADGPPVSLAPPLSGSFTFSLSGQLLLAGDCGQTPSGYLLDLTAPGDGWRGTQGACGAALSPDADSIIWSPDNRRVFEAPIDGQGDARTVVDVSGLPRLPPGLEGAEIIGSLDWGPQGVAFPLGTTERQAAVTVSPEGDVNVAALGNRGAGLGTALAWQPGGELLASGAWSNLEAGVRLSSREETRVVAIHPDPIAGLVWSPDGDVLLAASNTRWTFVAPDGTWISSLPVPRGESLPLAWRSA